MENKIVCIEFGPTYELASVKIVLRTLRLERPMEYFYFCSFEGTGTPEEGIPYYVVSDPQLTIKIGSNLLIQEQNNPLPIGDSFKLITTKEDLIFLLRFKLAITDYLVTAALDLIEDEEMAQDQELTELYLITFLKAQTKLREAESLEEVGLAAQELEMDVNLFAFILLATLDKALANTFEKGSTKGLFALTKSSAINQGLTPYFGATNW